MDLKTEIITLLPYSQPFLFVDKIINIEDGKIIGEYTFKKEADFYKGHFKDKPVTPGVLITECAAQISLACYGIFKLKTTVEKAGIAMTSTNMDFLKVCYPDEKLSVVGEEIYFRFNKLKMAVKIFKDDNVLVAKGELAGMLINSIT